LAKGMGLLKNQGSWYQTTMGHLILDWIIVRFYHLHGLLHSCTFAL